MFKTFSELFEKQFYIINIYFSFAQTNLYKPVNNSKQKLKRKNPIRFMFNDLELAAFEKYCKKYRIKNKSKFIRETVMTEVLVQFDKDYPSLFDNVESESN